MLKFSDVARKVVIVVLVAFVAWCAYAVVSGLAFGQMNDVPAEHEITYAEHYQIAKKVGTPWVVVLKSSNNPLQALGIVDGWKEVAWFLKQENAEAYLHRLVYEPDAPTYERLSMTMYGKELQTRVVELP